MKVFHVVVEYPEADAFFDCDGNLLLWWDKNDAYWSSEYMDPLLQALGIEIIHTKDTELAAKIQEALKSY